MTGDEFLVLAAPTERKLFTCGHLHQAVDSERSVAVDRAQGAGRTYLTRATRWSPDGVAWTDGFAWPVTLHDDGNLIRRPSYPTFARVDYAPRRLRDLRWPLGPLTVALEASLRTGNPVVGFHNGASDGFDPGVAGQA